MKQELSKPEFKSDLKYLKRYMTTIKDPFSYFYLLAKVHKTPWKTRPIISTCGSTGYGLAKWVDAQLKLIVDLLPYTTANSYGLSLKLRELKFTDVQFLYTSDAVSMYTNIDTNHAMMKIKNFLLTTDYATRAGINVKALISGLEIIMYNNIFKFGDSYWHQLSGTAMGTPPAPNYATLYFAIHEMEVIPRYPELKFYCRYLDDCFGVWTGNAYRWWRFQCEFGYYGKLTWEYSTHKTSVNFLDLEISLQEDGTIKTSLFEKALNLYLYLPPHSAHASGMLRGLISGMILRIKRLTSDLTEILPCLKSFYNRLIQRGYDKRTISPLFQEYMSQSTDINMPTTENPLILHLKYHPKDTASQLIQRQFRHILLEPDGKRRLPEIPNRHPNNPCNLDRMIIAYSRNRNIGELISPRKFHTANGARVSTMLHGDDTSSAVNPNPN